MELTEFTSEALKEIRVRPVERSEEARYQEQMAQHHYLGALAKIGETVWYVAIWREQWVAQLSLSAAALKCGVRDRMCFQLLHHWIGWDFRTMCFQTLAPAVWPAESDRQQQPFLDPARLAPAEYRLTGVVADRTAGGVRLAYKVRSSFVAVGDFC